MELIPSEYRTSLPPVRTNGVFPVELLCIILEYWSEIDPPTVCPATGRAVTPGFTAALQVPLLRQLLISHSKLFARNLAVLPAAYHKFLEWCGNHSSNLHFELSRVCPSNALGKRWTRYPDEHEERLWEQLIARPDIVARVSSLCLIKSRNLDRHISPSKGEFSQSLSLVKWDGLKACRFEGILPRGIFHAPNLKTLEMYWIDNDKSVRVIYLARIFNAIKAAIEVISIHFGRDEHVDVEPLSLVKNRRVLPQLRQISLGPINIVSLEMLFRMCKVPMSVDYVDLEVRIGKGQESEFMDAIGDTDAFGFMYGVCASFRIETYRMRMNNSTTFKIRLEAWRKARTSSPSPCQSTTEVSPDFYLSFVFSQPTFAPTEVLATILDRMSRDSDSDVLILDHFDCDGIWKLPHERIPGNCSKPCKLCLGKPKIASVRTIDTVFLTTAGNEEGNNEGEAS